MLDKCSITLGEHTIEDTSRRPGKVWPLLMYLICNRGRVVSQEELIEKIWENDMSGNPAGALKTNMWRARQLMETLDTEQGHEMIKYTGNGYRFGENMTVQVDSEEFERLAKEAFRETDADVKREKLRTALGLYKNGFLERFSSEIWVSPISAYMADLFLEASLKQLELLEGAEYAKEAANVCRAAIKAEPYNEELYRYLIKSCIAAEDYGKADDVYEELRSRLFDNLGVLPEQETQALHEQVLEHLNSHVLTVEMLGNELREKDPAPGPILCEFSVFKKFYRAEARSLSRRGDAIHVGMLTVVQPKNEEFSQDRQERAMKQLQEQMLAQLRRGDLVSRLNGFQFAVMLQANYENSNMVCDRIVRAFMRAHPRSKVRINYTVLSLEPLKPNAKSDAGEEKIRTSW